MFLKNRGAMKMRARFAGICLLGLLSAGTALARPGDGAPPWLTEAAKINPATYDKKVTTVVLVDDGTMTVSDDGTVTSTYTYAVRILSREGRNSAVALTGYTTDRDKVKDFRAWLIKPSGQVKSYGKNETMDASETDDVYDESRSKRISATADVEPGVVFGYQTVTESKPYFHQTIWYFQGADPVVSSRLTLNLPVGWQANGTTFNHSTIQPSVNGNSYTWELRDLQPVGYEPASPPLNDLVPRVAIRYFPGEGAKNPGIRIFEEWRDVSRWYSELADPQAVPDERIAARARELTSGLTTELDRIRAIAKYVQGIQYISIQIGVGRWRPHSATDVFTKAYGDCKDKANLMRAMLKTLNIQSYPVLIFSGDPTYVREAWISPGQFNHCIVAIKVSPETRAATIIQHPELGSLLIFDATDEHTPVGDLPDHEQGSLALIAAGDKGSLVRMPEPPPEASQLQREADVVLTSEGSITATVKERSTGQAAVTERRAFRSLSIPEYKAMIEEWVTRGAAAARVQKVAPTDESVEGRFGLEVEFTAADYGQLMQGRLLVFKPAIISRRESLFLTEEARRNPVVIKSRAFTEIVRVKLPMGFDVDELPDPVKLQASFGSYETKYEVKGSDLVFTRSLSQRAATIPPDQYQTVRSFFSRIRSAEQAPVVLARK
jgi:hypothetical protein